MAAAKQDSASIQYLKQDKVGKVIAQGLATLYSQKPQKPVAFLANWLLNYAKNTKEYDNIQQAETVKKAQHDKLKEQQALKQKLENEKLAKEHSIKEHYSAFEKKIENHEYHQELLVEEFPEFLEHAKGLTGVYIGELNHPTKKISEEDTDENAHLNLDAPKVINYIGTSKSHHDLLFGKTLSLDKGVVTNQAFNTPEENQNGKFYTIVPDVIKSDQIHFMKLPRLGAFIAIPFIHKSYLFESMFDTALADKKKYNAELKEFQKDKETQLAEYAKELEEAKLKLEKAEGKNTQPIEEEIKQIEAKHQERLKEEFDVYEPEFEPKKRQFALCADTLGQDREIPSADITFLCDFVGKFVHEWQATELRLLKHDVELQIAYEATLHKPAEAVLEEVNHELQIPEEVAKELNQVHKEPHLVQYHSLAYKVDKLKEKLATTEVTGYFLQLKQFRVLKFSSLVQHLLYFLGYSKEQIDIPNTTHLNWKDVKKQYMDNKFINALINYQPKGPKPAEVKKYARVTSLLQLFENIPEQHVFEYNIGLGMILKYVKLALTLRKEDVELRKQITEQLKHERNQKLAENEKINSEKEAALDAHKATLAPEELDAFDEQEWLSTYEAEHPLVDIPPEIKDDPDHDI